MNLTTVGTCVLFTTASRIFTRCLLTEKRLIAEPGLGMASLSLQGYFSFVMSSMLMILPWYYKKYWPSWFISGKAVFSFSARSRVRSGVSLSPGRRGQGSWVSSTSGTGPSRISTLRTRPSVGQTWWGTWSPGNRRIGHWGLRWDAVFSCNPADASSLVPEQGCHQASVRALWGRGWHQVSVLPVREAVWILVLHSLVC